MSLPQPSLGELSNVPERVAGVTVGLLPDECPYVDPARQSFAEKLQVLYDRAQRAVAQERQVKHPGVSDERVERLSVYSEGQPGPHYDFLLTQSLIDAVALRQAGQPTELTLNEILYVALEHNRDAVEPRFEADAPNAVNVSYYSSEIAFHRDAGLATLYAENRPLNYALGAALTLHSRSAGRALRIKELCSGGDIGHWEVEAQGALDAGATNVEVTLSDFVAPNDPGARVSNARIKSEQYSLLDDMPQLPEDERYDAIITTYGFDSVWQPEDVTFVNIEGEWYQRLYRIKVADWNPRRDELISAMRTGQPLPHASMSDYEGIFIETVLEPADLTDHPFASFIRSANQKSVVFPGGLIKRVVEAFANQLSEQGVFISADVGNFGKGKTYSLPLTSGIAAVYKAEDYAIAKRILEQVYGLQVDLLDLNELAEGYLPFNWIDSATQNER